MPLSREQIEKFKASITSPLDQQEALLLEHIQIVVLLADPDILSAMGLNRIQQTLMMYGLGRLTQAHAEARLRDLDPPTTDGDPHDA